MSLRQNSRIFRQITVPDLLQQLLFESHIKADYMTPCGIKHITNMIILQSVIRSKFCRLAAEEGISFWFEDARIEPGCFTAILT